MHWSEAPATGGGEDISLCASLQTFWGIREGEGVNSQGCSVVPTALPAAGELPPLPTAAEPGWSMPSCVDAKLSGWSWLEFKPRERRGGKGQESRSVLAAVCADALGKGWALSVEVAVGTLGDAC